MIDPKPPLPMDDVLDRAVAAIRRQTIPDGPPSQVQAAMLAKMRAAAEPGTFSLLQWIKNMKPRNRFVAAAASLLVATAAIFSVIGVSGGATSLVYAQALDALKQAKAVHAQGFSMRDGKTVKDMELWYSAGRGVREREILAKVGLTERLDDGTFQWLYRSDRKSAIKSASTDPIGAVHELLDDHRIRDARDVSKMERLSDLDRKIDDAACRAYVPQPPVQDDRGRRMVLWVDDAQRPRRLEKQELKEGQWVAYRWATVEYDKPLPDKILQPDFGPGVEIIDATKGPALDFKSNLLSGEVMGLVLTVHEVYRLDNDAILMAWSVQPSEETIKKFGSGSSSQAHYGDAQQYASKLLPSLQQWKIQPMDLAEYHHGGGITYWTVLILKFDWSKPVDGLRLSFSVYTRNELQKDLKKNGKPWHQQGFVLGDLKLPKETVVADQAYRKVYGQASSAAAQRNPNLREVQLTGKTLPWSDERKKDEIRLGMRPEDAEKMMSTDMYTPNELVPDEFVKNIQHNDDHLRELK